jgi:hypothetical protein
MVQAAAKGDKKGIPATANKRNLKSGSTTYAFLTFAFVFTFLVVASAALLAAPKTFRANDTNFCMIGES